MGVAPLHVGPPVPVLAVVPTEVVVPVVAVVVEVVAVVVPLLVPVVTALVVVAPVPPAPPVALESPQPTFEASVKRIAAEELKVRQACRIGDLSCRPWERSEPSFALAREV